MSEMYKLAAKNQLRFQSSKGMLTVEQLFSLPLKSQSGFDLDSIAKAINKNLKSLEEESFVDNVSASPEKKLAQLQLDIVKDVIATKQAENAAAVAKATKAAQRKKILDAMAAKQDAALTSATMEDLEKKLAALED